MTTLWAEGFEDASAAQLMTELSGVNLALTTGRHAGKSAVTPNTSTPQFAKNFGGTASTIFASFAFKPTNLATQVSYHTFRFREGGTLHIGFNIDASGGLTVYRNATSLAGSGGTIAGLFTVGIWTWIQVKFVIHDTTGSVEIRDASGTVLMNMTGVDTRNAGTGFIDSFVFGDSTTAISRGALDDVHFWDSTGSICNTWTNDTRIDSLRPSGAGNVTAWTPSAGSNWQCVDETPLDTADYVSSATAAQQDLYAMTTLPHTPSTIFSATKIAVAKKDDAGARSLKLLARNGGTTYAGASQTLTLGTDVRLFEVLEANPATSTAWTPSTLSTAQFGIENV